MKIEDFVLQMIEHRNLKQRWLDVRDSQPLFDAEVLTRHVLDHKLAPAFVDDKDISLSRTDDGDYVVCEKHHGFAFNEKKYPSLEQAVGEKIRLLLARLSRDLEWIDYVRATLAPAEFVQMLLRHPRNVDFSWKDYFGLRLPYTLDEVLRTVRVLRLERSFVDAEWKGGSGIYLVETEEGYFNLFEAERGIPFEEKHFTDLRAAVTEKITRQLSKISSQLKSDCLD